MKGGLFWRVGKVEPRRSSKPRLRQRGLLLAVAMCLILLFAGPGWGATYYVSANGTGDCTQASPCDFQTALDNAAADGDNSTIIVAPGIYNIGQTLNYQKAGGDGKLTIEAQDSNNRPVLDGQNARQIMSINTTGSNDAGNDTTVNGLVFQRGNNTSNDGGGLYINTSSANIEVKNSLFANNTADGDGGGACLRSSSYGSITVSNSTFQSNTAHEKGGGGYLYSWYGNVTVSNSTFQNNTADEDGGGACLFSQENDAIITNSSFENNAVTGGEGGGAYLNTGHGDATISNSTFKNNTAKEDPSYGDGGGANLFSQYGSVNISNSTFQNNTSDADGGGAHLMGYSEATISDTSFENNTSGEDGGGAYLHSSPGNIIVSDSTFSQNSADEEGGGMYVYPLNATANIVNNSFYSNTAASGNSGGGIYASLLSGNLTLYNNILWENDAGNSGNDVYVFVFSSDYQKIYNNDFSCDNFNGNSDCLILTNTDNYYHDSNISADPQFADAPNGDFHIQPNSPCVDMGNNDAPDMPATDFEGDNRIIDGDGDGASVVDMGADEFLGNTHALTVQTKGSGTVTSNPAGIDCPGDCNENYDNGTDVTLTATPGDGSQFIGWGGDCAACGNNPTCQITMDSNKDCTANFTSRLKVSVTGTGTVTSNPAGIDCPGDCNETYNGNTQVTLIAAAGVGFRFAGWGGDCAACGNNPTCQIAMDRDKDCKAIFQPISSSQLLSAPTGLTASVEGGCAAGCVAGVKLSWNAVRGADGYLIYNAYANQLWKWVKEGTATSYTFNNLPCGRTYQFYIKTHSSYGNSRPSKTVAVVIPPCSGSGGSENPAIGLVWPEDNSAINYNDFDAADYLVVFAWNKVVNAKGYLLWLKLDDGTNKPMEASVVLSGTNGLIEAGDLAGIYFVLDKAGWNSLVPYTVTWQVSALSDPNDLSSILGSSDKYSFTFNEAK